MKTDYDLLIVGGGMVGASLACALGNTSLRIGIVEAYPFTSSTQPSYDDRSIALSFGTRKIFDSMGIWSELQDKVTPIENIHVSDRGYFGVTRMSAVKYGFDALGYVVENRELGGVFLAKLPQYENVDLICPAILTGIDLLETHVNTVIEENGKQRTISTALIIGADGGNSVVRKLMNINAHVSDYGQTAVIANVTPDRCHENVAYERFTDTGPLALLPMSDNRCSLVWTVLNDQVDSILGLDESAFLARLQERFGYRLGRLIKAGKRNAYPLKLVKVKQHTMKRLALIGNAAHTLHPIAGQGFNLGLRDVAALAQVLVDAAKFGDDPGATMVLKEYGKWRDGDQKEIITLTDSLVKIFSNNYMPVGLARSAGLLAFDVMPPLKRALMRKTMGLSGRQPRLTRGLPV
ncbi:MAG: 2-octaprenyl-6-methoxyphenyl hydroxylase [Gammaproteobacteria bacterium]